MTAEGGRQGLAVLAALLLAGCAETSGARWREERQSTGSRGARGQGLPLVLGARPGKAPEVLSPYLAFINAKRVELSREGLSRQEKREGERALLAMQARVVGWDERVLGGTSPAALYERCRAEAWVQLREDEACAAAQDEYWQWGW